MKPAETRAGSGPSGFLQSLQERAVRERIPLSGTLELTHRCNLNCIHCYCNEPAASPMAGQELSCREWCAIIDQIAAAGCLWLLFTGGECLLRPDFPEIWVHAKERGLLLTLFTNATLITPTIADLLAQWPPYRVEVTLYGATPATSERVTRSRGGWEGCWQGVELLRQRGIRPVLKTMVLRQNVDELPAMRLAAEGLGLEFRFDALPHARPARESDGVMAEVRLSPQEVAELDRNDPQRWQAWQEFAATLGPRRTDDGEAELFPCSAGLSSFHITPYGSLQLCGMVPDLAWDLRRGPFDQGWVEAIPRLRSATVASSPCLACDLLDLCNQCPGWSVVEHHQLLTPVEFLCRVTKERARMLAAE